MWALLFTSSTEVVMSLVKSLWGAQEGHGEGAGEWG